MLDWEKFGIGCFAGKNLVIAGKNLVLGAWQEKNLVLGALGQDLVLAAWLGKIWYWVLLKNLVLGAHPLAGKNLVLGPSLAGKNLVLGASLGLAWENLVLGAWLVKMVHDYMSHEPGKNLVLGV